MLLSGNGNRTSRAIDALRALAGKSEAGEADGDFIDIQHQDHLHRVMQGLLAEARAK